MKILWEIKSRNAQLLPILVVMSMRDEKKFNG